MTATGSDMSAGTPRQKQHRRYIVNPSIQWKFAFWVMLDVFAISAFMGILLFGVLENQTRARLLNPEAGVGNTVFVVLAFAAVFSLVTAAGVGLCSFLITRRFCGPIHVVGQCLAELGAGRLPVRRPLRKDDAFQDFYAVFWQAVASLEARRRRELKQLSSVLSMIAGAADTDTNVARPTLESAALQIQGLREAVAHFLARQPDCAPDATSPQDGSCAKPRCMPDEPRAQG